MKNIRLFMTDDEISKSIETSRTCRYVPHSLVLAVKAIPMRLAERQAKELGIPRNFSGIQDTDEDAPRSVSAPNPEYEAMEKAMYDEFANNAEWLEAIREAEEICKEFILARDEKEKKEKEETQRYVTARNALIKKCGLGEGYGWQLSSHQGKDQLSFEIKHKGKLVADERGFAFIGKGGFRKITKEEALKLIASRY